MAAAEALRGLGRHDEADERCRAVLADEPGHTGALMSLGHSLRQRGDAAGALPLFQAALERKPREAWARMAVADTLADLGRADEAEDGLPRRARRRAGARRRADVARPLAPAPRRRGSRAPAVPGGAGAASGRDGGAGWRWPTRSPTSGTTTRRKRPAARCWPASRSTSAPSCRWGTPSGAAATRRARSRFSRPRSRSGRASPGRGWRWPTRSPTSIASTRPKRPAAPCWPTSRSTSAR